MFNYVKAELWKLTQRPALFLTWGILFLLMVVYSVLLSGREYSNSWRHARWYWWRAFWWHLCW